MDNKQSYNLDVVLAKFKCITDFFSNNTGSGENSITHCWMLILTTGICGIIADAAAFWADGSVGCVSVQAKGDV